MNKKIYLFIIILFITLFSCIITSKKKDNKNQSDKSKIHLNQIGYYPKSVKQCIVVNSQADNFLVKSITDETVYTGNLIDNGSWDGTNETIKIGDFSSFEGAGEYYIYIEEIDKSYNFEIKDDLYSEALKGTLKSFYFLRAGYKLESQYAGNWQREAGHMDTNCILHESTGKSGVVSSPGGWYDAGDYGKYIVNGGITVGTLLALYELYPNVIDDDLNIPESGNGRNDLLDEVKYELDWMKTMQDTDGGIFFKLGHLQWSGFIMPSNDNADRYIIGKSTSSTLNFCAVMAQAARVYSSYDSFYSNDCLNKAVSSWQWAVNNPNVSHPTEIGGTGPYNDSNYDDEFIWAASELYISTGNEIYKNFLETKLFGIKIKGAAWWQDVVNLGYFSLVSINNDLDIALKNNIKNEILTYADFLIEKINNNPYEIPMMSYDFTWGSNGKVCNYGIILAYAYFLTNDNKYLNASIKTVDYTFGKNATGYTSVTGFGDKSPMHPHHRQSGADRVKNPVPGLVVGGANKYQEDNLNYSSDEPAKSYIDVEGSYASNENAINQNAPVVFMLGFLQANKDKLNN